MPRLTRFLRPCVAALLVLGLAAPTILPAQDAAPAVEDHPADFKVLTTDFLRLDATFAHYSDPVNKVIVSGYLNMLKRRAVQLGWKLPEGMMMGGGGGRGGAGAGAGYGGRGDGEAKPVFDQVKYDELRYDINLQYQRLATFLAPLKTEPRPLNRELAFDLVSLAPNPANAAETKAALDVLDHEIKRLEKRVASLPTGAVGRDEEAARLGRVKEVRRVLGQQFTTARWSALIAEFTPAE